MSKQIVSRPEMLYFCEICLYWIKRDYFGVRKKQERENKISALLDLAAIFHYRSFATNLLYRIQSTKNEEKWGFPGNHPAQMQSLHTSRCPCLIMFINIKCIHLLIFPHAFTIVCPHPFKLGCTPRSCQISVQILLGALPSESSGTMNLKAAQSSAQGCKGVGEHWKSPLFTLLQLL